MSHLVHVNVLNMACQRDVLKCRLAESWNHLHYLPFLHQYTSIIIINGRSAATYDFCNEVEDIACCFEQSSNSKHDFTKVGFSVHEALY